MLRFVASYFTSNIKPNTTNEEISQENGFNFTPKNLDFFSTGTEHSDEVEQPDNISTLRERKLKELTEKVLLRKIYRQVVMNRYAQDHLPLSQIQEKLEEDDLPLKVLQDKLRQKENSSIYTTIRENINFLLYSNPSKHPSKPKKSRQSLFTPIVTETDNINDVSTPRDDRDYDIWDDAIIGHLMNLVDTIGVDITRDKNFWEDSGENSGENSKKSSGEGSKENSCENSVGIGKEITSKVDNELIKKVVTEVINEVIKEEEFKRKSSRLGSTKVTTKKEDKETKVARSSATNVAIKKNTMKNIENNTSTNNTSTNIENNTSTNIKNNVTTNVENVIAENHLEGVKKDVMYDIQEEDESRKIAEEIINFGETINVAESLLRSDNLMNDNISFNSTRSTKRKPRRSLFSLGQQPTSSSNNKNPDQPHRSLKRNVSDLSRKSSIHSKKSYDNISRRSSISSKFSFSTDIIIEEQNEDGSINNKFSKRNHSSRKLHFLKNIWKNNNELPLVNNEESFISSREIREKYYQQFDQIDMIKPDQQQNVCGTAGSDPGYSNFYLSMPNGKWMVRTRTGSRKITGTQYVDKEFI